MGRQTVLIARAKKVLAHSRQNQNINSVTAYDKGSYDRFSKKRKVDYQRYIVDGRILYSTDPLPESSADINMVILSVRPPEATQEIL